MGSLIVEEMMSRDKDKAKIINRLVCRSSSEDELVHVIAIVGIGGQGKTTLAREIYNDKSLPAHFNLFSWVCVTEIFDVARVTKAILDDLKVKTETHELNPLQKELRGKLDGKCFLIILDDVWNKDEERWNELRASLTSGAAGSRILVTTRTQKVANTMNAVYVRKLQGLLEDDSWRLFNSRAFAGRNDKDHSDLQAIGRQIVSNCKGLPLSIKVMGRAMNSKRTVEDWQNILESKMWSLPEAKSKILPALWLSYYNLPPPLKPCFAYCSIYEKDIEMEKDKLVNLWVAQGFVHAQGNREIEDIAAEHFDDLVAWSMFQEASSDGSHCKIHDLLHDLAELITKNRQLLSTESAASLYTASILTYHASSGMFYFSYVEARPDHPRHRCACICPPEIWICTTSSSTPASSRSVRPQPLSQRRSRRHRCQHDHQQTARRSTEP
ncbi:hypothetical protein ACLOJK_040956 [Asimina triloba]